MPGLGNIVVFSTFDRGCSIRWDPPYLNPENAGYVLSGVNVYRAFSSDDKVLLTPAPVGEITYTDTRGPELVTDNSPTIKELAEGTYEITLAYPPHQSSYPYGAMDSGGNANATNDLVISYTDGETIRIPVYRVSGNRVLFRRKASVSLPKVALSFNLTNPDFENFSVSYYRLLSYETANVPPGYILSLVDGESTEIWFSPIVYAQAAMGSWIWTEAKRRSQWLYDHFGERVMVLKQKHAGETCPACREQMADYGPNPKCTNCYGTGITGGYSSPIHTVIVPPEYSRDLELKERGLIESGHSSAETLSEVLFTNGDVLIRQNGERFVIVSVQYAGPRGIPMVQTLELVKLTMVDWRYSIPASPAPQTFTSDGLLNRADISDWRELKTKTLEVQVINRSYTTDLTDRRRY